MVPCTRVGKDAASWVMPAARETSMFALMTVEPDSLTSQSTISSRRSSSSSAARRRTAARLPGAVAAHSFWASAAPR